MDTELDFIDIKIIELLQEDGRASHSAIAEAVGLSQPSVHERVKKLEQRGIIKGYGAIVDPAALGLNVLAYISVRFTDYKPEFMAQAVEGMPEVMETHHVAGEECFVVKVRCKTPQDLETVLQKIWAAGPVAGTKTVVAFNTYKETLALPLPKVQAKKEQRSA